MSNGTIIFPNLHIVLHNVSDGIHIGNFNIAFYGIIIGLAMIVGVILTTKEAQRVGINPDDYFDIAIFAIVFGILGARIYYVIFSWDYYGSNPIDILKIWEGGLAIYGGIIGGILTIYIICRIKKISFLKLLDVATFAVLIGQIAGRWGNFFNREAFGKYCDGLFAMLLPISDVRSRSDITDEMMAHITKVDGAAFISVHPTFLYESSLNLILLLIIFFVFRKRKQFDGQLVFTYGLGYGMIRFFVESLRTDQLLLWNTNLAVSQLLSAIIVGFCGTMLVFGFIKSSRKNKQNTQ